LIIHYVYYIQSKLYLIQLYGFTRDPNTSEYIVIMERGNLKKRPNEYRYVQL